MRKFFSLFSLLSLLQRHILPCLHDALVGRADDLIHVDKLLHAVGGPADDTRNRKDRGLDPEKYIGVGYCILGYPAPNGTRTPGPRKAGYVLHV